MLRRLGALGGGCLLFILTCCQPSRVLLSPVPDQISSIQGYASLNVMGEEGSTRSKFSFLLILPDRGRIEVSDFLGRSIYQIIIDGGKAFLVVPAKKVYWQGEEEDIIDKFLGFPLTLDEMISLFSGRWPAPVEGGEKCDSWILVKDESGRIVSGWRGELRFSVEEFVGETLIAHRLVYEHPFSKGRLRIIKVDFNQLVQSGVFDMKFLGEYAQKTWSEIQEMLNDAD